MLRSLHLYVLFTAFAHPFDIDIKGRCAASTARVFESSYTLYINRART